MKLTLHIGTEKTGSTSIQSALWADRPALAARGILVPKLFGSTNHMELAVAAMGLQPKDEVQRYELLRHGMDLAQYTQALKRQIEEEKRRSRYDRMLVSNEHCHSRLRDTESVRALLSLLGVAPEDTEVVVYLRRQDRLAVSLHSTRLKLGGQGDIFRLTRFGKHGYYFAFDKVLDTWAKVVGDERIRVRLYERPRLEGGDVVRDFYRTARLGLTPPASTPRDNVSLSRAQHLFLTRFNEYFPMFVGGRPNKARGPILEAVERIGAGPPYRPARAEALAFYEPARAGNAAVRRRFLPALDRPTLFDEDFSEYPESAGPEQLSEAEMFAFVGALWTFRRTWSED